MQALLHWLDRHDLRALYQLLSLTDDALQVIGDSIREALGWR